MIQVHIYSLEGTTFTLKRSLSHAGGVTDLVYSPDGEYLVAADTNRHVILYLVPSYELTSKQEWRFHNARVNCLAWSPNSKLIASGSLDTTVIVWSVDQPSKHLVIKSKKKKNSLAKRNSLALNFKLKQAKLICILQIFFNCQFAYFPRRRSSPESDHGSGLGQPESNSIDRSGCKHKTLGNNQFPTGLTMSISNWTIGSTYLFRIKN